MRCWRLCISCTVVQPQETKMIDATSFTPASALLGGVIIGLAAGLFVLLNGRVLGISGILGGLLNRRAGDFGWRLAFVAGLILAPVIYGSVSRMPPIAIDTSYPTLMLAG